MPTLADALGYESDEPQATTPPRQRTQDIDLGVPGRVAVGNIPIVGRPDIKNGKDNSTVYSMSFVDENPTSKFYGMEVVVPQADEGRILTADEAREKYYRTGQHLGVFSDPDSATAFAQALHRRYEQGELRGVK